MRPQLTAQHQMAYAAQEGKRGDHRGRVRVNCPFCLERKSSPDRRGSLIYYRGSGFYKCFRCGIRSRNNLVAPDMNYEAVERPKFKHTGGPPEYLPLWGSVRSPVLLTAVEYLEGRGIDADIRANAFIGACVTGRYANRIIIPHLDPDGTWWGWSARLWRKFPGARSYDYPPDMRRDKLYNQHAIAEETDRPVMVVEGVIDSLLYLPHAVACLGQPTNDHLEILKTSKRPVAMCLDADRWWVSKQWSRILARKGIETGWVRLPAGLDPNTVDAAMLRDAADRCIGGEVKC